MSVSDGRPSPLATRHWLATMASWKRWFSYTFEGMDNLRTHECKFVVGYHGRPLAWDLFMLGAEIHREQGYLPLALVHRNFLDWPYLRWLTEGLQWSTGKGPILDEAIASGRHVIFAPGGSNEGLRPAWIRYEVDWRHRGYLYLAIARGVEIVPVAASGVDEAYIGLNDSAAAKRRLGIDRPDAELWFGLGPLGLYPASPPFPVRVHQIIGAPVVPVIPESERAALLSDRDAMEALHRKVVDRLQTLLELARSRARTTPRLQPEGRPRLREWVEDMKGELPWHKTSK